VPVLPGCFVCGRHLEAESLLRGKPRLDVGEGEKLDLFVRLRVEEGHAFGVFQRG